MFFGLSLIYLTQRDVSSFRLVTQSIAVLYLSYYCFSSERLSETIVKQIQFYYLYTAWEDRENRNALFNDLACLALLIFPSSIPPSILGKMFLFELSSFPSVFYRVLPKRVVGDMLLILFFGFRAGYLGQIWSRVLLNTMRVTSGFGYWYLVIIMLGMIIQHLALSLLFFRRLIFLIIRNTPGR